MFSKCNVLYKSTFYLLTNDDGVGIRRVRWEYEYSSVRSISQFCWSDFHGSTSGSYLLFLKVWNLQWKSSWTFNNF